jgi:hypothetical protein
MAAVKILTGGTKGGVLVTFRLAQTVRLADMKILRTPREINYRP